MQSYALDTMRNQRLFSPFNKLLDINFSKDVPVPENGACITCTLYMTDSEATDRRLKWLQHLQNNC